MGLRSKFRWLAQYSHVRSERNVFVGIYLAVFLLGVPFFGVA